MNIIEEILSLFGLLHDATLQGLNVQAFPSSLADPLDSTSISHSKLATALTEAISFARVSFPSLPDPLPTPMAIAAIDGAGPTFPFAGNREMEMDYSASVLKVAAMYAAYQLRAVVNAVAQAAAKIQPITSQADLFKLLVDTLDKQIDPAVPLISQRVSHDKRVPSYQTVFDANLNSSGVFELDFTSRFKTAIADMIIVSDDEAAAYCIHGLGYSWLNGLLQSAGFIKSAIPPQNGTGIWLAGDFSVSGIWQHFKDYVHMDPKDPVDFTQKVGPKWDYVRVNSFNDGPVAQAMTCYDMAKLYVLLQQKKLVMDTIVSQHSCSDMLNFLALALTTLGESFINRPTPPPKFTVDNTKLGLGPLKTGQSVASEASIVSRNGTSFVVVWQNLSVRFLGDGSIDPKLFAPIAMIVDETIRRYLNLPL